MEANIILEVTLLRVVHLPGTRLYLWVFSNFCPTLPLSLQFHLGKKKAQKSDGLASIVRNLLFYIGSFEFI